jgi:hypothetical protein
MFLWDTATGINNLYLHKIILFYTAECQGAFPLHCLEGIDYKVEEELLQLPFICLDEWKGVVVAFNLNILRVDTSLR